MGILVMVYATDADAARRVHDAFPSTDARHKTVGIYEFLNRDQAAEMDPPTCDGTPHRPMSWTRSLTRGFMTCSCGGRHPAWRSRFIGAVLDNLGYNLMPRSRTPRLFQNPPGHRMHRRGYRFPWQDK